MEVASNSRFAQQALPSYGADERSSDVLLGRKVGRAGVPSRLARVRV